MYIISKVKSLIYWKNALVWIYKMLDSFNHFNQNRVIIVSVKAWCQVSTMPLEDFQMMSKIGKLSMLVIKHYQLDSLALAGGHGFRRFLKPSLTFLLIISSCECTLTDNEARPLTQRALHFQHQIWGEKSIFYRWNCLQDCICIIQIFFFLLAKFLRKYETVFWSMNSFVTPHTDTET